MFCNGIESEERQSNVVSFLEAVEIGYVHRRHTL